MPNAATSKLRWLGATALLALWLGCGGGSKPQETDLVASYKDKHLTKKMVNDYLPDGIAIEDSARIAEAFVKQWLKEQAIVDEALSSYEGLEQEVEAKVQDYRAKLIMHSYQERLIEESLEKEVSQKEIMAYYDSNQGNFISKEDLYSYFYIVTKEKENNDAAKWMKSSSEADIQKLREWASVYALESKLDSTFDKASDLENINKGYYGNLSKSDPGKLIRWNGVIQQENRYYLFKMIKMVAEGEPLTLNQCSDKIRSIILNERKISMIDKNEERIVKNAKANNFIKEYE